MVVVVLNPFKLITRADLSTFIKFY